MHMYKAAYVCIDGPLKERHTCAQAWVSHRFMRNVWEIFSDISLRKLTHKVYVMLLLGFNALRMRENRRHYADDVFGCISGYENRCILILISLKCIPVIQLTARQYRFRWCQTLISLVLINWLSHGHSTTQYVKCRKFLRLYLINHCRQIMPFHLYFKIWYCIH